MKKGFSEAEDYWIGSGDYSEEAIEIDCGVVDPS